MPNKIEQLKQELIINNNNFKYSYLIINLLHKGAIDELVNKITKTKTKVKITTLTKKNHLSGNEQFLYLLNNFIYTFKENFYFIQTNSDYIIEILLQNQKYNKYLLSKKHLGDNKYITYYSYNIKKLIIHGFYNNIKKLSKKSDLIKNFAKENKISLRKNLIDSNKEIEIIYTTLLNISICNTKELNNILLFEDIKYYTEQTTKKLKTEAENIKATIQQHYINNWETMIKEYYKKKSALNILLN